MIEFLYGFYTGVAFLTFLISLIVGLFDEEPLWKSFAWAIVWPVYWIIEFSCFLDASDTKGNT